MSFTGKMTDDSEPAGSADRITTCKTQRGLVSGGHRSSNPLKNTETVVDLEIPSEGLQPKEGTGGIKRCSNWEVNMYNILGTTVGKDGTWRGQRCPGDQESPAG